MTGGDPTRSARHALGIVTGGLALLAACARPQHSRPSASSASSAAADVVLLDEEFDGHRPGIFHPVVGPHTEYHYLPETAPKGAWMVSSFLANQDTQRGWRVIEEGGDRMMAQVAVPPPQRPDYHPMLVAGDTLWGDARVVVRFAPDTQHGRSGVAFRYRNDRCYYFFGVEGDRAVLKRVRHERAFRVPDETVLAERPFAWRPGRFLTATIAVEGPRIRAAFDGGPALEAVDSTYPRGRVALSADGRTRYTSVRVTTTAGAAREVAAQRAAREELERRLQAANPTPVVWKTIATRGFGVGRNLRFGDLDGDGRLDILVAQVLHHGPTDANSEVGALTALTLDGKVLWQLGTPDAWKDHLTNDVAVQVHDLDGDGRAEVVYAKDFTLIVADGATGKTKFSVPTPENPNAAAPYDRFPRILGDALLFADLRGTGHPRDVVLKDRYGHVWVYDETLRLRWTAEVRTGHYPFPYDVDGDGKQELAVGYALFRGDGTRLWTNEARIGDHADGIGVARLRPGAPPRMVTAASDEGILFLDPADGRILKHHRVGHVQAATIANLRDDLPGLEVASMNFWGNQGIAHLFDADGTIYHDFEVVQHGSLLQPVNWTGRSEELLLLSADVDQGGLYDGWGRRVVRFPADGHPDLASTALDLTGDGRDEIVVWDPYEIWIYTQSDGPKQGPLHHTVRNPHHNESNYRVHVSRPAP